MSRELFARKEKREAAFPPLVACSPSAVKLEETQTQTKWSELVTKSLRPDELELADKFHAEQLKIAKEKRIKNDEERKKRREEAAKRNEFYYIHRMMREYGIEEYYSGICQPGEFWYFFVEGRKDDSKIAKEKRNDMNNQDRFKRYLGEKYWNNWLGASEYTEDDCAILERWRWEAEKAEHNRKQQAEREIEEMLRLDKEQHAAMRTKVEKGEMTENEYWLWKRNKEIEDDYAWQCEGDTLRYYQEQEDKAYNVWKARRNL